MTQRLALAACLALAPLAHAQQWWRVYPTSAANDSSWFTGVAGFSADGRRAFGWQSVNSNVVSTAVWDVATAQRRPISTQFSGNLRAVSASGDLLVGHTNYSGPVTAWRCSADAECETLTPFLTVWSCSDDGATVLGTVSGTAHPLAAARRFDGSLKTADTGTPLIENASVSADGSTAYYIGGVGSTPMLYRWVLGDESPPVALRGRVINERVVGISEDGRSAYFASVGRLVRFTQGVGFESINGVGAGFIERVTRDGRYGVARYEETDQQLGNPGYFWSPFTGCTDLATLVPGLSTRLGRVTLSEDGGTIAGTYYQDSGQPHSVGFIARLPSPGDLTGDYSLDGVEDQDDVASLIHFIAGAPNPYALPIDYNRDGSTDTSDVADLVNCIAGGCP